MSEDEAIRSGIQDEEGEEVEAHKRHKLTANEEPTDEARRDGDDDDFEAHRRHLRA